MAIAVLMVIHFVFAAGPITLYVDAGSSCTSGCGSQADPYPTIQAAINDANAQIAAAAATEATIEVAAGHYGERIFIYPDVHVQCASPAAVTIDGTGFARSTVIFATGGTGRPAANFSIDGCTITGGSGEPRSTAIAGGGIFIIGDAVVSNSVIRDNVVNGPRDFYDGGGIYVESGHPVITGNTIMNNVVDPPPLGGQSNSFGLGAGIYVLGPFSSIDAQPRIEGNIIVDNYAGGQIGKGGGIRIDGALGAEVTRNIMIGNRASHSGGGIEVYNDVLISDNLIYGNSALLFGGGIDTNQSAIQVTSNTIFGNSLTETTTPTGYYYANYGGGINVRALIPQVPPEVNLTNNLIAGNSVLAEGVGAGIYSLISYPVITHTDSWDNLRLPATVNNIEGDFTELDFLGGTGNISQDPLFGSAPLFTDVTVASRNTTSVEVEDASRYIVNQVIEYNDDGVLRTITNINTSTGVLTFTPALPSSSQAFKLIANWDVAASAVEDFRLPPGSPGTDAGDNGVAGTLDLDGNPRVSDGDNNGSPITDMGAYELPSTDPDGDGDGVPASADCDDGDPLNYPGNTEVCDGQDNDCDSQIDEGGWVDSDGDGMKDCIDPDDDNDLVDDPLDCAPLVNSIQAAPGPIGHTVRANAGASIELTWLKIPQSNTYHIFRGSVIDGQVVDFAPGLSCFISESPDRLILDADDPPLHTAYVYVLGGTSRCGNGDIGTRSDGTLRSNPAACLPLGSDTDSDLVIDIDDNCPLDPNPGQQDPDLDNVGAACDNCPALYNPDQSDQDGNGLGDHCQDLDGDTFTADVDCDDNDPAVNPGAVEVRGNAIDEDCDGEAEDADGDGFSQAEGDCNDLNQNIFPGQVESCDQVDNNCDTLVDEGFDADGDTYTSCDLPVADCDDGDPAINPGATEIRGNPVDENCDGEAEDEDGDGLSLGEGDCLDTSADVYPGAPQICDGHNNDCNDANWPLLTGLNDGDDDGDGLSECQSDCNDADGSIWGTPGEVTGVIVTHLGGAGGTTTLDWPQVTIGGLPAGMLYDVVRSADMTEFVMSAICLETDEGPNSTATDLADPPVGGAFIYLLRAENGCGAGQGSLGTDSAGTPRVGLLCP